MKVKFINSNSPTEIIEETYRYYLNGFNDFNPNEDRGIRGKDFDKRVGLTLYKICNTLSDFKKSKNNLQEELDNLSVSTSYNFELDLILDRKHQLLKALSDIKENKIGKNFLLGLYPDGQFGIDLWNTKEELDVIIETYLRDYDALQFFSKEKKYMPENMLDTSSLQLIEHYDIPLRSMLVRKNNEYYLDNYWRVEYEIILNVDDDFDANDLINNNSAVHFKGDILTCTGELENMIDGYNINPLAENVDQLIDRKVALEFQNNLESGYFNDEGRLLDVINAPNNDFEIKIISSYFKDVDNLLK